jgi:hypothetical protein
VVMLLDSNLLHRRNGQGGVAAAALHWAVCHYCRCFPSLYTSYIYNTPVNIHIKLVLSFGGRNTCLCISCSADDIYTYTIKSAISGGVENRSAAYFLWRLHLSCGSDTSQQTSWHATQPAVYKGVG